MTNEMNIGWRQWIWRVTLGLIPIGAIILGGLFSYGKLGAHHLWGTALIVLGLTALNGKIWRAIWRAFRGYLDNDIKMIPHL